MSGTWQTLHRITEASEKDNLLKYILHAYGEHAHDSFKDKIEKRWNPEGLVALQQHFANKFHDPQINKILDRAAEKFGVKKDPAKSAGPAVRKRDGEDAIDQDRKARMDKIKGLASGDYVNPADVAKQHAATAATAAMRPDRAGTKPNLPNAPQVTAKPGERPTHDVGQSVRGTAPNHTRPPQAQPSQAGGGAKTVGQQLDYLQGLLDKDPDHPQADKIQKAITKLVMRDPDEMLSGIEPKPSAAGSELDDLRKRLDQAKQRMTMLSGLKGKPGLIQTMAQRAVGLRNGNDEERAKGQELAKKVNLMRKELEELPKKIGDMEKQMKRIGQVGKSGLSDAQRQVDTLTKAYPKTKLGDKLAAKLGVPPTSARTSIVTDPDTGKKVTRIAIWSAEKIAKWKQQGPELEPGTYDTVAGAAGDDPEAPKAPWQRGEDEPANPLPTDKPNDKPVDKGSTDYQRPMHMVPKGASDEDKAKLAALRHQYNDLKKGGASPEELALVKDQINQMLSNAGELVKTVLPGKFHGHVFRPSGISQQVRSMRPDKATGKMVHGTREISPEKTGAAYVWDANKHDYVPMSQFVSNAGEKNAAELGKKDRPWASSPEVGSPLPKDAEFQKKQAAHVAAHSDDKAPATQQHRANKDAVKQAFFAKKSDAEKAASKKPELDKTGNKPPQVSYDKPDEDDYSDE